MRFFWQRPAAVSPSPAPLIPPSQSLILDQFATVSTQLTRLETEMQVATETTRITQQTLSDQLARLDGVLREIRAQLADAADSTSREDDAAFLAEHVVRQAYALFRDKIDVSIVEGALQQSGGFTLLPIDPDQHIDLIFFQPVDPTKYGVRVVLNRTYAFTNLLTNTIALHIDWQTAPPGLCEALLLLHRLSGPIMLAHREPLTTDSFTLQYWPYSSTHHDRNAVIQNGAFRHHLIFYYLKSGETLHTYLEPVDEGD